MAGSFPERSRETIRINCPVCGGRNVDAAIYGLTHSLEPVGVAISREVYVRCTACQGECRVAHPDVHQLASLDADQIDPYLVPPASRRGKVLAALGLLLFWIPVLGLYVAWQAWRHNRGTHGTAKAASVAAVIVSAVITVMLLMGLVVIPIALLAE